MNNKTRLPAAVKQWIITRRWGHEPGAEKLRSWVGIVYARERSSGVGDHGDPDRFAENFRALRLSWYSAKTPLSFCVFKARILKIRWRKNAGGETSVYSISSIIGMQFIAWGPDPPNCVIGCHIRSSSHSSVMCAKTNYIYLHSQHL